MPSRAHIYAAQSDDEHNFHFRRRWSDRPMSPRDLEQAAEIEQAHGNKVRADLLAWAAHEMRVSSGDRQ